jgi:hypothetical protein
MGMISVTKKWERHHSISYWDEITEWCYKQFGYDGSRFHTQATTGLMHFHFEREEDASLFIMKWM